MYDVNTSSLVACSCDSEPFVPSPAMENESKTLRMRELGASEADAKLAFWVVGKANFEHLAIGNQQVYRHPLSLALWLLLSFGFIHLVNWWPSSNGMLGILAYLRPLPAFATIALPLIYLVDWINRPYFEERTQNTIKSKDMHNPARHYSKSPASGFWIFEYGKTFVGLIAVDAADANKTRKAVIRHFYVEEAYRRTGIQEDMLNHALAHVFGKSAAVESIEAVDALGLTPHLHDCYMKAGFRRGTEYQSAGIFGRHPFLLLQSTAAQTIFPLLRALCSRPGVHTICCASLYAPSTLVDSSSTTVETHDWTSQVPGYGELCDLKNELVTAVKSAPKEKPLAIVIDSLEILSENLSASVEVYELLSETLGLIKAHPCPSQLIAHSVQPDDTADLFLQTTFSSSLVLLRAHPTSLIRHLSKEYMIAPPPVTEDIKFWSIFIPFSERAHELDRLSFGSGAEGSGCGREIVVEILTRGVNAQSRKRGTERVLEGWDTNTGTPCQTSDLQSLKLLFSQKQVAEAAPDPTQNLSFNLSLNESQQQSRAKVPLPYAHEGQRSDTTPANTGAIFYDPDSADDIDDDDPDEDLDI
ncbi:hypothetical protein NP233_g9939 [Leucocoprinus birnbaumii]|uniref:Elongator complex protein 5 n=1 Tax=Leucocoprinus birnbaumii TaxID=56174 RepID=A0AAD5VJH5_9AGAR|nr:hypothetical protein NP233_g9939 [Leucocoprinus birnbaumii]